MQGSLCLHSGVLYVGRHAKTAEVSSYDLDGHALETRFTYRDEKVGRSAVTGIDLDADHRIWAADAPAGRLRAFTLFGQEVVTLGGEPEDERDARGALGRPVDVVARGSDDDLVLLVASAGTRRHALQLFRAHAARVRSLAPLGDPEGRFRNLAGVAWSGELLFACEAGARRVQVFRNLEFHFAWSLEGARGVPQAVASLSDGRVVLAIGGGASALVLADAAGRPLATLAEEGTDDGQVSEPTDVAVEEGASDRDTRVAVVDREGERVQVFTLDGRCYGAFTDLGLA